MKNYSLPPLSQEPIRLVDATPDEGYPLRILRAYRQHADCMWANSTWADGTESSESLDPVLKLMNEHNRQRALILDRAISILEKVNDE